VSYAIFTGITDHLLNRYTFEVPFGRLMMGCLIGIVRGWVCDFVLDNIPRPLYPIVPVFLTIVSVSRFCRFVKSLFR
jgi:hypothetical protein